VCLKWFYLQLKQSLRKGVYDHFQDKAYLSIYLHLSNRMFSITELCPSSLPRFHLPRDTRWSSRQITLGVNGVLGVRGQNDNGTAVTIGGLVY
jgi:hypothetical protein